MTIDSKAKSLLAEGHDVINFGAGEPDFPTPAHIVEAAAAACRDPSNHRYSPTAGLPELREAIALKTRRDSGYEASPAQVVVTNGGKQAVYEVFATLLDPGDEVLVPAPYWTTYPEAIALAGGVAVPVRTDTANGFRVSVDQLEAAWTRRTKVVLFVSPNNPTGAVYERHAIEEIGRWALGRGLWVVTDEIYEHLVYPPAEQHSMPVLVPELADRAVVLNGVAKTYAMTGWRVGWLVAPRDIADAVANLQSHLCSNVANVSQRAALAAVTGDLADVARMREVYDQRRRRLVAGLSGLPDVVCGMPEGAFYVFPDVLGLLGRDLGAPARARAPARAPARAQAPARARAPAATTVELAEVLLDTIKIAVVPGEAFGAPGHVRMAYALADADLDEGLTRLAKLLAG